MEVSGRIKSKHKQDKGNIFCQPCQGDGDNIPADGYCETCNEYFCSSCLKVHRKQSVSKNHVIKAKHEMPRVHIPTDPCSQLCDVHKTEVIKFFCQDHNTVGCGDCMVLKHKSCEVQLVSDVSSHYDNSDELNSIEQKLLDFQQKISASKDEIKRSLTAAQECKVKVINEIKTFRREMNNYLDNVETELVNQVEKLSAKDISHQRQLLDDCEVMKTELQDYQKKLDQFSDKINDLFVTAKLAQTKLLSCQQSTEKIASKSQINICMFAPCEDMNTLKLKKFPIGIVETRIQKFRIEHKKRIADMKAHFVNKVNVRAANEPDKCKITGLAMISPDEIVLADCNNDSLKIFNTTSNTITSYYKLHCSPWDVTMINPAMVASTLPDIGSILFMSTRNGLSESRRLKVRKNIFGIDQRNGVLALSFINPPAIQILNKKGDILHEVNDTRIFEKPYYIAFRDGNNIVVSDFIKKAVYELTIAGHLKVTMKREDLTSPVGLTVTSNGTVVVCDRDKRDKLSMIVPETNEILPLTVQHVESPWSVVVCEESSMMYICENLFSGDRDFIKIYNLK